MGIKMDFENLLTLIDKVASTDLSDFTYGNGELKISMKRKKKNVVVTTVPENIVPVQAPSPRLPQVNATADGEQTPLAGNVVKAPLVGTFYNSSAPETPPFVKVGDAVKKGQILGIIEAMKLMNEIESEFDGVVEAVLTENEHMVEYGQPLFIIK